MRPKNLMDLLMRAIPAKKNVLIVGGPGIGKTDIVKQACEKMKSVKGFEELKLITSHPVVSDPTDYKGLPYEVNGEAVFLPFNDLKELITTTTPIVFFIDDFGQAEPSVQKSLMQLLWGGKLNGYEISPLVTFIAATNRKEDKAGVQGILECIKSRFHTIVHLEPNLEDWVEWAKENEMPMELIAYVRFREKNRESIFEFKPTMEIANGSCPRTIANAGNWMNIGYNPIIVEHFEIISGAVGQGFALGLKDFLIKIKDLPDIDDLIKNAEHFNTPKGYNLPIDRPDLAITICGALVYRIDDKNCDAIMKIADRMEDEYSFVLVHDAVSKFEALEEKKCFRDWAVKHKEYIKIIND